MTEVLKYARGNVRKFIYQKAFDLPDEQKEEIEADAMLRVIELYPSIDPELGWKSLVYTHCFGAVLDYKKMGKGFAEERFSLRKLESNDSPHVGKISTRLSLSDPDGEQVDIDQVLGAHEAFAQIDFKDGVNWNLVAKMSASDKIIWISAMILRGHSLELVGQKFGLSAQRAWAVYQKFLFRFDDPNEAENPWLLQSIYAFGLCEEFGLPEIDQTTVNGYVIGWGAKPVDLDDLTPVHADLEQIEFDLDGGFKVDSPKPISIVTKLRPKIVSETKASQLSFQLDFASGG